MRCKWLPRLSRRTDLWSRDNLYVVTGHPGPGVKDTIDYVTGAASRDRYKTIVAEGCEMKCNSKMKYEWWVSDGEKTANINLRPDFVPRAFYSSPIASKQTRLPRTISKRSVSSR